MSVIIIDPRLLYYYANILLQIATFQHAFGQCFWQIESQISILA